MQRHGRGLQVELDADGCTVTVLAGPPVPIKQGDELVEVAVGAPHRIARAEFEIAAPASAEHGERDRRGMADVQ